jgi:hypothetical protein
MRQSTVPAVLTPITLALALITAGAASAQTYVPGQTQQMLNQEQLNIQSLQLQQMQQHNQARLQSPNPAVSSQAAINQQRIQQQTSQNNAIRQQMLSPSADPAAINGQIQLGARVQPSIRPVP